MSLNDTQREVIEWLATGRVGLSSKCMAMWLAFQQKTKGIRIFRWTERGAEQHFANQKGMMNG